MLNNRKITCLLSSVFIYAIAGLSTQAFATGINEVMQEGEARADAGEAAQKKVDSVADQTEKIINDFRSVTKVVDGLRVYNALLQTQLNNQEAEMQALSESISNVALIERQIIPLMTRMVDALEEFVKLDTPFLLKERTERVARLREMMERSDVTAAEKFRRVIEGYQIENDYGRTIEAYKGSTQVNGNELEVDFLRIGRVALMYQTVGGATTGAWDTTTSAFVELPAATYQKQVSDGLKIARKQVAPDLLIVPVAAPTRAMQ
jgi:archaellum component FlaC